MKYFLSCVLGMFSLSMIGQAVIDAADYNQAQTYYEQAKEYFELAVYDSAAVFLPMRWS